MKSLWLLRHAKSARFDSHAEDHDRPLTPRGEQAADRIGEYIGRDPGPPTLVLCSTARRAVETLERVLPHLPEEALVEVDHELYLAAPETLLGRLSQLEDATTAALVVGHNPGLAILALELAAEDESAERKLLERKFPTAALAVLQFAAQRWSELVPGSGRLTAFVTPKRLERRDAQGR